MLAKQVNVAILGALMVIGMGRIGGTTAFIEPRIGAKRHSALVSERFILSPLLRQRRTFVPLSVQKRPVPQRRERENEIRRKIMKLKKEGRISKNKDDIELDEIEKEISDDDEIEQSASSTVSEYDDRIKAKLGKNAKILESIKAERPRQRKGRLGSLSPEDEGRSVGYSADISDDDSINVLDPTLDAGLDDDGVDDKEEMDEADLVELVARKLDEKRQQEARGQSEELLINANKAAEVEEKELFYQGLKGKPDDPIGKALQYKQKKDAAESGGTKKTTTGIGGVWQKNVTAVGETRRPSRGSWGYFPRPNDISKAYGGGKKVGAGVTKIDPDERAKKDAKTQELLRRYRESAGIEVQGEKEHAAEIEEALRLSSLAMQRGVYATAVSVLEKVTGYCGANSPVGSKVFLELAMAYEAVGRSDAAIAVYTKLSECRIEEVKSAARRLLYGIEAMKFMRDEAKSKDFSRKKIADTFNTATGFKDITKNFDGAYNTAWIDRDSSYFRSLTEAVVRTNREARQILLKAVKSGEVSRLRVVQALRSISRNFDDALIAEAKEAAEEKQTIMMNGKPIVVRKNKPQRNTLEGLDKFELISPDQMLENLSGEWRLQLLADLKGEGVNYFNKTLSWQELDTSSMKFDSFGPAGFSTLEQSGLLEFNETRRVLIRSDIQASGGFLSSFMDKSSGAPAATSLPQQVMVVDSVLLVTKMVGKKRNSDGNIKDYFVVWRRVEPGTYTGLSGRHAL